MNASDANTAKKTSPATLFLFWAYVTIPLVWGVTQTFGKIAALFH